MAFKKPEVTTINPDIKNISIYIRSTKKFGKTSLFASTILHKYGDPKRGMLIACGHEKGFKLIDKLNATHVNSWAELKELKDWLINEKGKEHNIEMVCFDTADELCLLADKETIRLSNIEYPNKRVRSIKAAFGGYTAGEKYSANEVIKPLISELTDAGFGVWVIAHSAFKQIKEKGSLEEDGYMQLTSNLGKDYESAFGDILDITLTGIIDREIEERGDGDSKKKYATGEIRKLYFRGTSVIDAGGRFADGAVPEYMVFDKRDMGADFIKIVEEGMEKSKNTLGSTKPSATKKTEPKPVPKKEEPAPTEDNIFDIPTEEPAKEEEFSMPEPVVETESIEEEPVPTDDDFDLFAQEEDYPADLAAVVKELLIKSEDEEKKTEAKNIVKAIGKFNDCDEDTLKKLYDIFRR